MILRRSFSLILILISGIFFYRMSQIAPWDIDIQTFLFIPVLIFSAPVFLLAVYIWFMPIQVWHNNVIPLSFIGSGILVLLVQHSWLLGGKEELLEPVWHARYASVLKKDAAIFVLGSAILLSVVTWPHYC